MIISVPDGIHTKFIRTNDSALNAIFIASFKKVQHHSSLSLQNFKTFIQTGELLSICSRSKKEGARYLLKVVSLHILYRSPFYQTALLFQQLVKSRELARSFRNH